jgi:hypothetical protein
MDAVAPGKVVEGGAFRIYSKTWTEGADGYVFIDDDPGDAVNPIVYYGTVQPGGYLEITPLVLPQWELRQWIRGEIPLFRAGFCVSDDPSSWPRRSHADHDRGPGRA